MSDAIRSIVDAGTKLWLDTVDPDEVLRNKAWGATGATSNPVIISGLLETGRFDDQLESLFDDHDDDEAVAWEMTHRLVTMAQEAFLDVWEQTRGDNGYVSFELDPLLEDEGNAPPKAERVKRYIELGKQWATDQKNRMIKVPATEAGLEALEELAAAGITLNVTLIFTQRQYEAAREAIWRGAQRRKSGTEGLKSVYSIFISRVDVYTSKQVTDLSDDAQGMVGLVNAKRLWESNQAFWKDKGLPLQQEIIFASTGKKLDWQDEDYYVAALVGSDIQTNPPETNAWIAESGKTYERTVDRMPSQAVLDEVDEKVDMTALEEQLMKEGKQKFADPMKKLLASIKKKRAALQTA